MDASSLKYADNSKFLRTRSDSGTEYVHYPALYKGMPEEAKEYARRELNESDENKEEGIRILKEFMQKERLTCSDDCILVAALRTCKYNIPKSESKLKKTLEIRHLVIKHISQMSMEKIELLLDRFIFVVFPWRDENGTQIWYSIQPSDDKDGFENDDIMYCWIANALFMMQFPLSSIYGVSFIGDNRPYLYENLRVINFFRKFPFQMLSLPFRLNRVNVINENSISRLIFNIISPFLPEKIKKRITFHGSDMESLHSIYHPALLPENLGGTLGPISNKHYREELLTFIKRLREENTEVVSTDL